MQASEHAKVALSCPAATSQWCQGLLSHLPPSWPSAVEGTHDLGLSCDLAEAFSMLPHEFLSCIS